MPEPKKLERVPPLTVISDSMKLVDSSERVKVSAAVSPAFREAISEARAMVGRTLLILTVILAVSLSAESEASTVKMC